MLDNTILYEDLDIVVIAKPAGVVVNTADSVKGITVQEWFSERVLSRPDIETTQWQAQIPADTSTEYGTPEEIFAQRGGVVHRLDKDTSGILILAQHPGALLHLLAQFRQRTVQKTYLGLAHGQFAQDHGTIKAPIARSKHNRHTFVVAPQGGRQAITSYVVRQFISTQEWLDTVNLSQLSEYERSTCIQQAHKLYAGFSLVECSLHTGRTHQIRVHMKYLNHPLVGDQVYAGKKRARLDMMWCHRQFLHASTVTFTHPRTGKRVTYTAPLPPDLPNLFGSSPST